MIRRLVVLASGLWVIGLAQTTRATQAVGDQAAPVHGAIKFDVSDNCMACHNGLTTPAGEDVSIGTQWRASMMANSARDPYWQASVRRETIDHPLKKAAIEDECAICHMPMARTEARQSGRVGEVLRLLPSARLAGDEHRLAADGVACTLCHQIGPERLGTRDSFVGGFVIGRTGSAARRMFGAFEVNRGLAAVMRSATDVEPSQGDHIRSSELCATCHTLYTEAFDEQGAVVGTLPEQVPYLEWRHSAFAGEKSCQSCHMPPVKDTAFSSVLGESRDQWGRHTFLGGNYFMLRMLNRYRDILNVVALPHELEASAQATLRQLASDTAAISIARAEASEENLQVDVIVRNLTGHKLPTGYPSRRAWIHLTVRDAEDRIVFESGAVTPSGAIDGNDNDSGPTRFESHRDVIRSASEVQIYESILGDPAGAVTTGLLRATQYLKDNRLLPRGFEKRTAPADIAVIGTALQDADFTDESDRVRYIIPLTGATGSLRLDVELRYQPIAFRWADNLRPYADDEPKRFFSFFDSMAQSSSAVLASDRAVTAR
jgi:hypothetical protein